MYFTWFYDPKLRNVQKILQVLAACLASYRLRSISDASQLFPSPQSVSQPFTDLAQMHSSRVYEEIEHARRTSTIGQTRSREAQGSILTAVKVLSDTALYDLIKKNI